MASLPFGLRVATGHSVWFRNGAQVKLACRLNCPIAVYGLDPLHTLLSSLPRRHFHRGWRAEGSSVTCLRARFRESAATDADLTRTGLAVLFRYLLHRQPGFRFASFGLHIKPSVSFDSGRYAASCLDIGAGYRKIGTDLETSHSKEQLKHEGEPWVQHSAEAILRILSVKPFRTTCRSSQSATSRRWPQLIMLPSLVGICVAKSNSAEIARKCR